MLTMTDSMSPLMMERIDAGVEFLDENLPDWRELIDPSNVDMNDGARCVLGQYWLAKYPEQFGSHEQDYAYLRARSALFGSFGGAEKASNYGFTVSVRESGYYFHELTTGWRRKFRELGMLKEEDDNAS